MMLDTVSNVSKRGVLVTCTAVVLRAVVGSVSVSADESVSAQTTTGTTVVEQFDEVSGLIRSQIADQTIEVNLSG